MDASLAGLVDWLSGPDAFDDHAWQDSEDRANAVVEALSTQMGRPVLLIRPEDIFNFYDVQAPVDQTLDLHRLLSCHGFDLLDTLEAEGRSTAVLRLVLGTLHPTVLPFWQRFIRDNAGWRETTTTALEPADTAEAALLATTRDALTIAGLQWLDADAADELVIGVKAVHPAPSPPRVRDILFPGSAARID